MAVLSVLSLNCHGFNKATESYLHRVCKNIDVILLQETWLSDKVSAKIAAAFPDFVVFHSSAMEDKLACGIRTGRPFGGTAVLICKRYAGNCHAVTTNTPRLTAVNCQLRSDLHIVFCSVYLPYDDGSRGHDLEVEEMSGFMQSILDNCLGCKFIFGGDFNMEKHIFDNKQSLIANFCSANQLYWLDHVTDSVDYTYHTSSLHHYSLIDHFICSDDLITNNEQVLIHNDGDNMSDHLAISCILPVAVPPDVLKLKKESIWKPMWDKADLDYYQMSVSNNLSNIALPIDALNCTDSSCHVHYLQIEKYYHDIVQCLKLAERTCVPTFRVGFHKHWWSPQLDELKQQCIDITDLWTSIGRPRCGVINAERLRCKFRYKQAIKEAANEADQYMNDDLFNHMCSKDTVSFWKSWRKRFCSRSIRPTNVLNGKSGENILPEFTNFYKDVFKPHTADADDKFKTEVEAALNEHVRRQSYTTPFIDINDLGYHIDKLKRRKAAGIDGLVNEHIMFGGPHLVVHLCLLFNCLLKHAYVPNNFCQGIIIPLLKSKHGDATRIDMYRGITLSPVLSKLFESVLFNLYEEFLGSDNLQFGFKKGSSTNHAMFALHESIKYYAKYGTKVFGAFLDSSKAFDKVLHNALLKKMLDKNVPVSFVLLLKNWYSRLCCSVKWNNSMGQWFPILSGVRQGGVLSPYLYAIYVDDLINELRGSGLGIHIGSVFVGSIFYADDIVLLSPSCHGLQGLLGICDQYANIWDIKFNPAKSQIITFGGKNPQGSILCLNGAPLSWVEKVKYLGSYIQCNTGTTDLSCNIRKYYGQFNNVLSVLGKYAHEMSTLHLVKAYCLSALLYGAESWSANEAGIHKASVAWNNSFRHIFHGYWRESVKPLQYFCELLPLSYLIDQRRLLFWQKMMLSDNIVLCTLSRLIQDKFKAIGNQYGIVSFTTSTSVLKLKIWETFATSLADIV